MSEEASVWMAYFQRGVLLRGQNRPRESVECLEKAIQAEPEKAPAYAEMALSLNVWPGHDRQALGAIDRALALDPGNAHFVALKGWILVCQRKYREALQVARRAVEMNPVSIAALNAQANAYTKLGDWKQAEASARRILALEAHDAAGLNLLAQALRLQGRGKESREVVERLLALLPDNAFGHMNAGYGALEVGDHLRANEHFLNSLRMDPSCDLARKGLLHSLRGRVWIYRLQFRIALFLRQPASFLRVASLAIGLAAIIPAGIFLENSCHGLGVLFITLLLGYLYLVAFSKITGDIFLLFEPMGRHALTLQDKIHAGLFALALASILGGGAYYGAWGTFATIAVYLGIFAFSIYYPQIKDRWREAGSSSGD